MKVRPTETNEEARRQRQDEKRQWKDQPGNHYSPAEMERLLALEIVLERPPPRPVLEL